MISRSTIILALLLALLWLACSVDLPLDDRCFIDTCDSGAPDAWPADGGMDLLGEMDQGAGED